MVLGAGGAARGGGGAHHAAQRVADPPAHPHPQRFAYRTLSLASGEKAKLKADIVAQLTQHGE